MFLENKKHICTLKAAQLKYINDTTPINGVITLLVWFPFQVKLTSRLQNVLDRGT